MSRVYVLSSSPDLAARSDYGPGWESAWTDPEGRRFLPFRAKPRGYKLYTAAEARAYVASFPPLKDMLDSAPVTKDAPVAKGAK